MHGHMKSAAAFLFLPPSSPGEVYRYRANWARFSAWSLVESSPCLLTGTASESGHITPSLGNTAGAAATGGTEEAAGVGAGGCVPNGTVGAKGGSVGGGANGGMDVGTGMGG